MIVIYALMVISMSFVAYFVGYFNGVDNTKKKIIKEGKFYLYFESCGVKMYKRYSVKEENI